MYKNLMKNNFVYSQISESVADASSIDFMISTSTKGIALNIKSNGGGDHYLECYKSCTHTSGDSTSVVPCNLDLASLEITTTSIYSSPSGGSDGILIYQSYNPVNVANFDNEDFENGEFFIDINSKFLVRVTNKGGSAKTLGIKLFWYERK